MHASGLEGPIPPGIALLTNMSDLSVQPSTLMSFSNVVIVED